MTLLAVTPCALKLLGRGRWTCATHGTAGGPDECLGLCPAAVAQQQEVARECEKPGHTHDTPGADGVPTTRPFLKTDCPACVDAALDPFKLALAEARAEGDRLTKNLATLQVGIEYAHRLHTPEGMPDEPENCAHPACAALAKLAAAPREP